VQPYRSRYPSKADDEDVRAYARALRWRRLLAISIALTVVLVCSSVLVVSPYARHVFGIRAPR
jgi:hypothetical protein